jgi:hypothetical protein
MKKIALFLLIVISSCQYDDVPKTACDVRDPANDLPWLKRMIHEMQSSSIHQYLRIEQVEYEGEIGFYFNNCCPTCNTIPTFYKCSGEILTNIDASKLISKGIVWQPIDFTCRMNF